MKTSKLIRLILVLICLFIPSCKKVEKEMMVKTGNVTEITISGAKVSGKIIDLGEGVSEYGHCYSKEINPTIERSKTTFSMPSEPIEFFSELDNLDPGTVYYVRAYTSQGSKVTYGDQINFTTSAIITDINGNEYNVVHIGTQYWMKQDLKVLQYNDEVSIPRVRDYTAWINLTTPGSCEYNNEDSNYVWYDKYGLLYNWFTVNTGKLCPIGWHVPSISEWTTLIALLGGENVAGGKMKETGTTHWLSPNNAATNESGFTALPGGIRSTGVGGDFCCMKYVGYWWSNNSDAYGNGNAFYLMYYDGLIKSEYHPKGSGYSVRCIKD